MGILIPLVVIFFTCLIIWRACDGFEIASEYLGRNMSEGVRGGTINAISSSIPELFTTLIALFVLADEEGFSVGLGTTAGSALFNGMIIPSLCIFFVVGAVIAGQRVDSVNVSTKVVLRDGLTLIFCNVVLVFLINGEKLYWWQGLILMVIYSAYLAYMILSMKQRTSSQDEEVEDEEEEETRGPIGTVFYWISGGPLLDLESIFVKDHHRDQIANEKWNAWPLLIASTFCIGVACWLLVIACEWLGTGDANTLHPSYEIFGQEYKGLGMSAMFVAVIFAAMATSVPDTIISIRDARDGDYDDAVANALGSNIFDICFALGFPLFAYTLMNGPIQMPANVAEHSSEIRLLLLGFTIVGFLVYYLGRRGKTDDGTTYVEMGKTKAIVLFLLYLAFVAYIVARANGFSWAVRFSEQMQGFLEILPK